MNSISQLNGQYRENECRENEESRQVSTIADQRIPARTMALARSRPAVHPAAKQRRLQGPCGRRARKRP